MNSHIAIANHRLELDVDANARLSFAIDSEKQQQQKIATGKQGKKKLKNNKIIGSCSSLLVFNHNAFTRGGNIAIVRRFSVLSLLFTA